MVIQLLVFQHYCYNSSFTMESSQCADNSSPIESVNESDSPVIPSATTLESAKEARDVTPIQTDDINIEEVKKESREEKVDGFSIGDYTIPELKQFEPEVVYRFLRKYGSFSRPHTGRLTNRERKRLRKFSKCKQNRKEKKKEQPFKRDQPPKRDRPKIKMFESNCKQRVAFDLSYFNENLMRFIDMRMLVKQIQRCYSINRQRSDPLQFHITSVVGEAEKILSRNLGYKNWDVNFHEKSFLDVFKKEDIVYLTSESENVIETIDESKVYIIGGLLDHNSLKGLSYRRAIASNIAHGRLPIDKYMDMKKLKVLPVNQVYSVISLVVSGMPWSEALIQIIPKRRQATVKANETGVDMECIKS